MNLREDDITQDTEEPQGESPQGSGKYYYDDSTGYELYEPTTALDEEEPEGEEATAAEAERDPALLISSSHFGIPSCLFSWGVRWSGARAYASEYFSELLRPTHHPR